MDERPTIGFIGAGRAAGLLGVALARAGYPVVAVGSRSMSSAEQAAVRISEASPRAESGRCVAVTPQEVVDAAELVLVTTPDDTIADVSRALRWRAGQGVAHCSGALPATVLSEAGAWGARTGSWHPFQTLTGVARLEGVTFGIEAEEEPYDTLAAMSRAVGAVPLPVPAEARPLYHAASVLSCGYLTTLLREARRLWEAAGLPGKAATPAIGAIAEATLANLRAVGDEASLTGPTSRGDAGTVRLHLEAIAGAAPELLPLYSAISRRSAVPAHEAGRPAGSMDDWDALFEEFVTSRIASGKSEEA